MDFKEALEEWVRQNSGLGLDEIDRIEIVHDEGYYYSSLTFEDPHTDVVAYLKNGGQRHLMSGLDKDSMTDLLNSLIAIAIKDDNGPG